MKHAELQTLIKKCLPADVLKKDGQLLYSGIETLRPGEFYFVGFNPAADGTNQRLSNIPLDRQGWSAYTQQCWKHQDCDPRVCPYTGQARHQQRVQGIMRELGLQPKETFATNLIFVESRSARGIYEVGLFEACWRVHSEMLAEVRPKFIICLGNGEKLSAFSLMRQKADCRKTGPACGTFKSFVGSFRLNNALELTANVIGVRHPSYPMNPNGLRNWLSRMH